MCVFVSRSPCTLVLKVLLKDQAPVLCLSAGVVENVRFVYRGAVKQVKNLSMFSLCGVPTVFGAAGSYSQVQTSDAARVKIKSNCFHSSSSCYNDQTLL